MAFTPKTPMKVIVAAFNIGTAVLAALNPEIVPLTLFAVAIWGIHALMALVSLAIAPRKGKGTLAAVTVLFVGTLSFIQLITSPSVPKVTSP